MAKAISQPKQRPPIQFRPGGSLAKLIGDFARENEIEPNDACKALVALAINELDCRFYKIVAMMAATLGGPNGFTDACMIIRAQLEGARRRSQDPLELQLDPSRAIFVQETVLDWLRRTGNPCEGFGLPFLECQQNANRQDAPPDGPPVKARKRVPVRQPPSVQQPDDPVHGSQKTKQ
jgi:hypothetical protein